MSIISPVIIFVIFAAIVMIMTAYSKVVVVTASREAARQVAVGAGQARPKVEEVLKGANLKVENIDAVEVKEVGNTVRVKVKYKQASIFPGLPALVGGSKWSEYFLLSSEAVFKRER